MAESVSEVGGRDGRDAGDGVLRGEGLVLRPWRPDDVDVMRRLFDDPEVDRWTPLERPFDRAAAGRYLARALADERGGLQLAITTDGHTALGEVLLFDRGEDAAEIGYAVGAPYRGRGLAPRAVRLVIEHATQCWGIRRFRLRIEAGNAPSRRVALVCGFRLAPARPEPREVKGRRVVLDLWEREVPAGDGGGEPGRGPTAAH